MTFRNGVMDDRSDILLLKQGDELAFERIYRNHWLKVYRFTGMFISDDAEREDILQAAFMRLWSMEVDFGTCAPNLMRTVLWVRYFL